MRALASVFVCLLLAACATRPVLRPPPQPSPPRVAVPPSPPPGEPPDIAGLHSTQLRELFGTPTFVRKDGAAEMWRYDGAGCKAFFFLYPFADAMLVRHAETLPRGRDIAADEACLNSLRPHPPAPASSGS